MSSDYEYSDDGDYYDEDELMDQDDDQGKCRLPTSPAAMHSG